MRRFVYSAWDGRQKAFSLDAEVALDELNRFLMEGLDLEESLDWMRQQGFELAGMDFRVMGLEELLRELREKARELLERSGALLDDRDPGVADERVAIERSLARLDARATADD